LRFTHKGLKALIEDLSACWQILYVDGIYICFAHVFKCLYLIVKY